MTKAARFIQVDMADRSEESGCRIPLSSSRCSCTAYKASGVKAFNKRIDRTRYRANFMQKIVSRYLGGTDDLRLRALHGGLPLEPL